MPGKVTRCKRASGRTSSASARRPAGRSKARTGAASKLGLNPGTLYWRMKKLGIQRPMAH